MSDAVAVALIVGVIGPGITWALTNWSRRRERAEEWARQDQRDQTLTSRLDSIEETGEITHGLVNSRFRDATQRNLESTARELASLRALVALQRANGFEPSHEDLALIDQTVVAIEDLRRELAAIDAATP